MTLSRRTLLMTGTAALLLVGLGGRVDAQTARTVESTVPPKPAAVEAGVDADLEAYLRTLQLLGTAGVRSWSIRSLSPDEIARMAPAETAAHPWAGRYDFSPPVGRFAWGWVQPRGDAVYNSSFPYGLDDGAVWAGRGFTGSLSAGAWAKAGPLRVTVAPVAYWAQNQDFGEHASFRDWRVGNIDQPGRFGSDNVSRLDPGASEARLDLPVLTLGFGTRPQVWGPAQDFPLILSRNAPGFPHAFTGTKRPVDIGIGRLHVRAIAGRLEESAYAPTSEDSVRFASAWVLSFSPRGFESLELGATRFFHQPWGDGPGTDEITRLFESFTKAGLDGATTENQLASIFARLALPWGGAEVYVEFAREDHSWDLRDFIGEPDHTGALTLGVARAWETDDGTIRHVRAELLEATPDRRGLGRGSSHFYQHGQLTQGHTHEGQVLGSPAAVGGGGLSLRIDEYDASGRRSVHLRRELLADAQVAERMGADPSAGDDVLYVLGADVVRFRPGMTVRLGGALLANLNRRFGGDRWGIRIGAGVTGFF